MNKINSKLAALHAWSVIALGVLVLIGALAAQASLSLRSDYLSPDELSGVDGITIDPDSLEVIDIADPGSGMTWELITYESSSGTCLDAIGRTSGGDRFVLGGCGDLSPAARTLTNSWNVGSVLADGSRHSVAFGLAAPSTSNVRLIFSDRSSELIPVADTGFWMFDLVVPAQGDRHVIGIDAINSTGVVIEQVQVPAVPGGAPGSSEEHSS